MPDQVSISIVITRGGDGALIEAVSVAGVDRRPERPLMRHAENALFQLMMEASRCHCSNCQARVSVLKQAHAGLRDKIARAASVFAVGASAARN